MLQTLLVSLKRSIERAIELTKPALASAVRGVDHALPQDHDRRKWVIVGFFSMPVLGAMVAIAGVVEQPPESGLKITPEVILEELPLDVSNVATLTLNPMVKEERIQHGDHILTVLRRAGGKTDGLQAFLSGDKTGSLLFSKLRAGRSISVQLDPDGNLIWMRYILARMADHAEAVLIRRDAQGVLSSELEKMEYDKDIAFRSGRIESSLFEAADRADMPESVAIKMAEIFSSQIDFHRELRRDDNFRVVYEQMTMDGETVGTGRVLAVEFVNAGQAQKAFYFDSGKSKAGYYDENGMSLRSTFLRSPLKFSRISSGFSKRRFHPVQKRWKAHYGVDYAAPTGTPIMATANGKVDFIGTKRGYGKVVYLKHNNGYSTRYAHMSRFPRGLRKGHRVEQGDIIGYVGATGWATGPHLHYEFRVNSQPKNPLTIKLANVSEPLTPQEMGQFKRIQVALEHRLNLSSPVAVAQAGSE